MRVITNKIKITVNYENIYNDFNVLIMETDKSSKESWKTRQQEIINLKKNNKIEAIITTKKRDLLYLQKKNQPIEKNSKRFEFLDEIEEYRVCNLLLQLLNKKTAFFNINEQDGGLYYFVKSKNSKPKQVVTLLFEADKAGCLQTKVTTFTNMIKNGYQKYRLVGKTMQLATPETKEEDIYIKKGNKYRKNTVNQFTSKKDDYSNTKEHYRGILLQDINKYLAKYFKLEFVTREMEVYDDLTETKRKKRNAMVDDIIKNKLPKINVTNYTEEDLTIFCNKLKSINEDIKIVQCKKPVKKGNNIVIVKDKEYYEKNEIDDPYKEIKKYDPYSQMVTDKNLSNKHALRVLLKELIIKQDIKNGKFSFTSEKQNSISRVYIPIFEKQKNRKVFKNYIMMEINNKSFIFKEPDLFDMSCIEIESIFDESTTENEVEAVLEDREGNLNVIYNTSRYTITDSIFMLEYYKNHDKEKDGSWNPKRKEFREQGYTAGLFNILYYESNDNFYYHIGSNKNDEVPNKKASPIRKVKAVNGKVFGKDILKSLDEYFVKNKDLTVLPYYIKYVREYMDLKRYL